MRTEKVVFGNTKVTEILVNVGADSMLEITEE